MTEKPHWYMEKAILENFLSHFQTEFTFTPNLNIVFGPNASGKSSLLDALYFILNENKTRYSTWKEYIQKGHNQAKVILEFRNGSKKLSIGRKIQVRGSLSKSEYLLNGKKVQLKELKEKLNASGLYLNNPLMTVKQSSITDLMGDLRPDQIRKSIEMATGLNNIVESYLELNESLTKNNKQAEKLRSDIERGNDVIKELATMLNKVKTFHQLDNEREQIEQEIAGWKVKELLNKKMDLEDQKFTVITDQKNAEIEYQELEKKREQLKIEIQSIIQAVKKHTEELGKLRADQTNVATTISDIGSKVLQIATDHNLSIDLSKFEEEVAKREKERKQVLKTYLNSNDFEIADIKETIQESTQIRNELQQELSRNEGRLTEITGNLDKLNKTWTELKQDITNDPFVESSLLKTVENLTNLEEILNYLKPISENFQKRKETTTKAYKDLVSETQRIQNVLEAYRKSDQRQILPPNIKKILKYIERKKIDVIGPVLWHLDIKGEYTEEIAKILKYALSSKDFFTFICKDKESREQLLEYSRNQSMTISLYTPRKYRKINPVKLPEKDGVFGRIIDQIACSSEVKSFLNYRIRDLVAVRDQSIADELAEGGFTCMTKDGLQTYRNIHEIVDNRRMKTNVVILQSFTSEQIQEMEHELTRLRMLRDQEKANLDYIANLLRELNGLIALDKYYFSGPDELKKLMHKIESLKEEIQSMDRSIIQHEQIIRLHDELKGLSKINQVWSEREELVKSQQEFQEKEETELAQISKLETEQTKFEDESDKILQRQTLLNQTLINSEGKLTELNKLLEICILELKENQIIANDVYLKHPLDELQNRQIQVEADIRELGILDFSVDEKLDQKAKTLRITEKELSQVQEELSDLENQKNSTRNEWESEMTNLIPKLREEANKLLTPISAKIHIKLTPYDIERSVIEIDVNTGGNIRPFSSYSGGERSILAMAIILALQRVKAIQKMCILDEFDQSLDDTNTEFLRNSVQTLSEDSQYIILTPAKSRGLLEGASRLIAVYRTEQGSKIKVWHHEELKYLDETIGEELS